MKRPPTVIKVWRNFICFLRFREEFKGLSHVSEIDYSVFIFNWSITLKNSRSPSVLVVSSFRFSETMVRKVSNKSSGSLLRRWYGWMILVRSYVDRIYRILALHICTSVTSLAISMNEYPAMKRSSQSSERPCRWNISISLMKISCRLQNPFLSLFLENIYN